MSHDDDADADVDDKADTEDGGSDGDENMTMTTWNRKMMRMMSVRLQSRNFALYGSKWGTLSVAKLRWTLAKSFFPGQGILFF